MLIDHVGVIFFPQNVTFRLIGRLAMPIFAFMVAEGCRYTHSKLRYLLILAGYLVLCQAGLYIGTGGTNLCILAAFALGAAAVFCLQEFKQALFSSDMPHKLLWGGLFLLAVALIRLFCSFVYVVYGFWGCMLPVFASIFHMPPSAPGWLKQLDCKWMHILTFTIGLFPLSWTHSKIQIYCLFSVPLLLCYNGRRGKYKLKYFFYIFYPAHLLILYGIYQIIGVIR